MTLNIDTFDPLRNTMVFVKFDLNTISFTAATEFPNFKHSYLKTSIMTLEFFFHFIYPFKQDITVKYIDLTTDAYKGTLN